MVITRTAQKSFELGEEVEMASVELLREVAGPSVKGKVSSGPSELHSGPWFKKGVVYR